MHSLADLRETLSAPAGLTFPNGRSCRAFDRADERAVLRPLTDKKTDVMVPTMRALWEQVTADLRGVVVVTKNPWRRVYRSPVLHVSEIGGRQVGSSVGAAGWCASPPRCASPG